MTEDTKAQELRAVYRDVFIAAAVNAMRGDGALYSTLIDGCHRLAIQAVHQWPYNGAARDAEIKRILESKP